MGQPHSHIAAKPLRNRRHEKIAQLVASGMLLHRAWQTSNEKGIKCTRHSAQQSVNHLMERPEVTNRIEYLKEQNARVLAERHEFNREHAIDYLVSILTTPFSQIDENHPLCEGKRGGRNGTVYWMPSKMAAMDLLCRMMPGWMAPTQGILTASPEAVEMIRALRNGEELPAPIDITPEAGDPASPSDGEG